VTANGPRLLLTNDDGFDAPGLKALVRTLSGSAELLVVAPAQEQSAIGCAVTLREPLHAEEIDFGGADAAFVVDGTPADCVKLALTTLFTDRPPALCVSGLNRGPNVGVNVFYSGTVGAALEAAANGVPAVAVSREFGEALSDEDAARLARPLVAGAARRGLPPWHVLNVNLPDRPPARIRGARLTRQGVSGFREWFREEPRGQGARRFSIEGEMRLREPDGLTDAEALAEGYVSVTPLALDLTARDFADTSGCWGWIEETKLG
jgi:5'-nucleotidase